MAERWREEDEGKQDQIVMERDLTWDGEHTIVRCHTVINQLYPNQKTKRHLISMRVLW